MWVITRDTKALNGLYGLWPLTICAEGTGRDGDAARGRMTRGADTLWPRWHAVGRGNGEGRPAPTGMGRRRG